MGKRLHKLMSSAEAVVVVKQPVKPCPDCPFGRGSLRGWLGGGTIGSFLRAAHLSDAMMPCHCVKGPRGADWACVGAAVYRANVCKRPCAGEPDVDRDTVAVFALPQEFLDHHTPDGEKPIRLSSTMSLVQIP